MIRKGKKQFLVLLMSAALIGTNFSSVYATETADSKDAAADTAVQAASDTGTPGTESNAENSVSESSGTNQEPAQTPSAPETSGANTPAASVPETPSTDTTDTSKDTESVNKTETSAGTDTSSPADKTENNGNTNTAGTDAAASANGQGKEQDSTTAGEDNRIPTEAGTETPDAATAEKPNPDTVNGENTNPDAVNGESANPDAVNGETTNPDAVNGENANPDAAGEISGTTDGESAVPDDIAAAEESSGGAFTNKNGEEVDPSSLVGTDYSTIADNYDGETNVIKQYAVSDSQEANTIMDSYVDENGNLIMIISQGSQETEAAVEEDKGLTSFFSSNSAPSIEGNFTGWDDIPASYEYNWDNSANCWQYGNWVTDPVTGEQICYKTEEGTYDSNVRHEMQLYTDNENVYLKITYATIYGSYANGEDFNFYVDGAGAKYQITWADGTPITGTAAAAGTYVVDVRNGDSSSSYSIVDGASAYYHVTENGINNALELKIPLSALQAQNGAVNLDNFSMIQFFTPNLMYNKISAAGSPTGAEPFAAAAFLFIPASYVWLKKKNKGEGAFA